MQRAVNTDKDIFKVGDLYYMCFQGVWFMSRAATGPWAVTGDVPTEIYTIPVSSPSHAVTYVTVEESNDDAVEFATAAAFTGAMVAFGCVVWGTGYYYPPYVWYGGGYPYYRPYYPTYGFGASYNPWTGAYTRGAVAYGPYGGAGVAQRYNPRTGTYSRGAVAYGPYGARGAASAYNPRTGTSARDASGLERLRQLGSDRRRSAATTGPPRRASTNNVTGVTKARDRGQRRRRVAIARPDPAAAPRWAAPAAATSTPATTATSIASRATAGRSTTTAAGTTRTSRRPISAGGGAHRATAPATRPVRPGFGDGRPVEPRLRRARRGRRSAPATRAARAAARRRARAAIARAAAAARRWRASAAGGGVDASVHSERNNHCERAADLDQEGLVFVNSLNICVIASLLALVPSQGEPRKWTTPETFVAKAEVRAARDRRRLGKRDDSGGQLHEGRRSQGDGGGAGAGGYPGFLTALRKAPRSGIRRGGRQEVHRPLGHAGAGWHRPHDLGRDRRADLLRRRRTPSTPSRAPATSWRSCSSRWMRRASAKAPWRPPPGSSPAERPAWSSINTPTSRSSWCRSDAKSPTLIQSLRSGKAATLLPHARALEITGFRWGSDSVDSDRLSFTRTCPFTFWIRRTSASVDRKTW